jgi:transposase
MDMSMSSGSHLKTEIITGVQQRRRRTPEQKLAKVRRNTEPGMSASLVTSEVGMITSQLFHWCKAYLKGSLVAAGANESLAPASELQDGKKRIKQLEAALGRKTLEREILKEAVDVVNAKKWIARSPALPGDEPLKPCARSLA